MARRTKEEAQETRDRLLDAAAQVFCNKGVTNTSLCEISRAAGVTRGAFYWHFRNKTALLGALWERTKLPLDEYWAADCCAMSEKDPLGRIRANAIDMLRRAVSDPRTRQVYEILFHKCENVDDAEPILAKRLESRRECAPKIQSFFRAAIDAGQLPKQLDPQTAMIGFFSYIDGLIYNWFIHPDIIQLDALAEHFIDTYIAGMKSMPASASPPKPS